MPFFKFFVCVILLSLPFSLWAKEMLRSSVAPEFIDGLHTKYLKNIAKHLDMELSLAPMPFARRIAALKKGEIDIMVGMQRQSDEQDEVVYIFPSYEQLRHAFFVLKSDKTRLKDFDDLKALNIGVTVHAKYFEKFHEETNLAMVGVSTLTQKIDLLVNKRIDTFLHFEQSTVPTLQRLGMDNVIVLAEYQPIEYSEYFVTISKFSPLVAKKSLLEKVVREAIENGEFEAIRAAHYAQFD